LFQCFICLNAVKAPGVYRNYRPHIAQHVPGILIGWQSVN